MEGKIVKLPSREEIMERLQGVRDDSRIPDRFYSYIAREAGHELAAEEVAMMLARKIREFVSAGYPTQMSATLRKYIPMYIDALVDDEEVAKEAKRFHQETPAFEK